MIMKEKLEEKRGIEEKEIFAVMKYTCNAVTNN